MLVPSMVTLSSFSLSCEKTTHPVEHLGTMSQGCKSFKIKALNIVCVVSNQFTSSSIPALPIIRFERITAFHTIQETKLVCLASVDPN